MPQPTLHPGSRFRLCSAQTQPQQTQPGQMRFRTKLVSVNPPRLLCTNRSRVFPQSTSRTTDINHSRRHPQTMAVCKHVSDSPMSSPKYCFTLEVNPDERQYDRDKIETLYCGRRLQNVATALRVSVGFPTANTVSVT